MRKSELKPLNLRGKLHQRGNPVEGELLSGREAPLSDCRLGELWL
jgi:hypothetical protein